MIVYGDDLVSETEDDDDDDDDDDNQIMGLNGMSSAIGSLERKVQVEGREVNALMPTVRIYALKGFGNAVESRNEVIVD